MHNGMITGFDVTTTDNEGWGSFGDISDTGSYGKTRFNTELTRFSTCLDVCAADKQRFTTVLVRVSTNENGMKRDSTNRHISIIYLL